MKIRAIPQDPRWRSLALLLDIRCFIFLVLLIFLALPFFSLRFFDSGLDRLLFRLGVSVQGRAVDTSAFIRVDVPAAELDRFLHDPASADSLMAFLSQWSSTTADGVLVLPGTLWTDYSAYALLESNAPALLALSRDDDATALKRLADARKVFQQAISNDKPLRAVARNNSRLASPYRFQWQSILQSSRNMDHSLYSLAAADGVDSNDLPLSMAGTGLLARPLIWTGQVGLRSDARLKLFLASQKISQEQWVSGHGIAMRDNLLETSPDGTILPHFSMDSGVLPDVMHYSLSQLTGQEARRILNGKIVVIGADGDQQADDLLYSVISLHSGHMARYWTGFAWFYPAFLILVFAWLLSFPYLPLQLSALFSGLFALALLLAQQIVLLVHELWFPVAACLAFLLGGHLVVFCWCLRRSFYPHPSTGAGRPVENRRGASPAPAATLTSSRPGVSTSTVRIAPVIGSDTEGVDDETVYLPATRAKANKSPGAVSAGNLRRSLGRFEVRGELGRGAMGVVYRGFDPKLSREVAIKTLHYDHFDSADLPAIKERFAREGTAAARLSHPNIVSVLDVGEEPDLAFMAMEYVRGQPLSAYIRKENLLEVELVYWIMALVADAVEYAHVRGIVHRDIKPSNILFDNNTNEVKVADFGIARFMDGSSTRTRTGDVLGSPLYMSPEQLKGERVTGATDIFSLGVTFYQLLTGELPFKGDNLANLSYQIVQCKFRPVDEVRPGLPESARRIINKALQKNPANRYASAGEMAEALQRAYSREFT